MEQASVGTNKATLQLLRAANGAKIEPTAIAAAKQASTLASRTGQTLIQVSSIALNMLSGMLIALAASLVIKGIDNIIHHTEKLKEAAKEAQNAINDAQSTLKTMSSTIEENRSRFLELSKGVDKFSNNLRLSEKDYAEYLSISQELADIAPSLIIGYDDQGNALLNIGNNAEETNQKLNDLLETQQKLTKQTIIDNLDAVAKGVYVEVKESKGNITQLKQELADAKKESDEISVDMMDIVKNNNGIFQFADSDDPLKKYRSIFIESLEHANIGYNVIGNDQILIYDFSSVKQYADKSAIELRDIALREAQDYYDSILIYEANLHAAKIAGLEKEIAEEESAVKEHYTKMSANLQAWLSDNYSYQYLSDNSQLMIDALIPNIDWDNLGIKLYSGEDYQDYIDNQILNPLLYAGPEAKEEIDKMFSDLLSFQPGDLDVISFAWQVQKRLNELNINLDITPLIADEQETYDRLQRSIINLSKDSNGKITTASGDKVNAEDYQRLYNETKDFTKEQAELWNTVTLNAANAEEALNAFYEAEKAIQSQPPDYTSLAKSAEAASEASQTLRSSISSLNNAFAEQREHGQISIDSILSLVDAGYAAALSFDSETGACIISTQAMYELVQAKIQNQIADLKLLQSNITSKLKEDGLIAFKSAEGFMQLAKSKAAAATAEQLTSIDDYNDAEAQIIALQDVLSNFDKLELGNYSTSFSSVSKSAEETLEELQPEWKEYLDKYLTLYQSELEAGLSDFNAYLTKSKALLEEYYRDGKISAKDYWDETKSLYESQLSIYDKVLSAVDRRFDTEIDRINEIIDGIEEQNESLENQKEIYDSALSAIQNFLDSKKDACQKDIDGIESENDALQTQIDKYDALLDAVSDVFEEKRNSLQNEMNLIQERIDALQEANDAQQKSIELEKARYELERAQNQRTKKVFNGTQFIYEADQSAVRDARDSLSDLELDTAVDALEQEKEAIQEVIDGLDKLEESWNRIPDIFTKSQNASAAEGLLGSDYRDIILNSDPELIAGIMHDYTNAQQQMEDNNTLIASIEEKMEMLDSLSDKWSGIADERENITNRENAVQLLGQEWESLILEQRQETFDEFRNHYLLIQSQIDDNTSLIESYQQKTEYYELLKEQWSSAADAYENSVNDQYAAMILGQNWESDILNGRVDTLNSFREQYITIQQAIADAAWDSANEQIKAAQEAEKAANGSAGNSGSVGSGNKDEKENNDDKNGNDDNNTRYKVVDEQGRTLVSYHGANAESNAYTFRDNLDDAIHDRDKVDIIPYAVGTNHASKGLGLVGEKGTETFIDNAGNVSLVTKPTLIPMEGGEQIKDARETKSLLNMDNLMPLPSSISDSQVPLPSDVFDNQKFSGKHAQNELWEKLQKTMPDLSYMIHPVNMVQMPKFYFTNTHHNAIPVTQNITLTLPNVTNNSGYERIQKELQLMQQEALQYAHRR